MVIEFLKIVKQSIHLTCRIKPNSSFSRVGIKPPTTTSSHIEICVAAPARDNEANEAVIKILSRILKCPKTNLEVVRGEKSRQKVIAYRGLEDQLKNDEMVKKTLEMVRRRLEGASRDAET